MRLFELRGISKHFGAIQALSNVNLNVDAGEVLGLMGDNGAGKSTLIKIMAGNFLPSSGEIWLKGTKVEFHNPVDARRKGVEVVYQDLALCDNLTAAENVFLGREAKLTSTWTTLPASVALQLALLIVEGVALYLAALFVIDRSLVRLLVKQTLTIVKRDQGLP